LAELVPTVHSYGMTYVTPTGIVGCNKADTSLVADAEDFPWNSSDCALSIALGYLYTQDPVMRSSFFNSYYCFIEAVQNMGKETNIYCNGTNKSGHCNCSWFSGINHSEICHTRPAATPAK
jgi:hypothetical protein